MFIPIFICKKSLTTYPQLRNVIRPPLQLFSLEGRYAHALYSAAYKEKKLDLVEKDLLNFNKNLSKDKDVEYIVFNPLIPRKPKKEFLSKYSKNMNFTNLTSNFLNVIVENGRYNKIKNIIKAFESLMASHRGEINAEITTAQPIDNELMKEIEMALHGFIKKGEILKIKTKVDPSIIGGLIAKIGDKYVDMSISSKLNMYKRAIQLV